MSQVEFRTSDGVALHVEVDGTRPPLFLVNGAFCTVRQWDRTIAPLAACYRVGLDRNARDIHRDNPHFEHTREFIEKYDMPAFDESYASMSLDEFEPMVRRVLSKDLSAVGRLAAS